MAVRLAGWLNNKCEAQLLLGNHWLQEKNTAKAADIKSEPGHGWRGLYHDNGSCLDIINTILPGDHSTLQVLQSHPLLVTDGQSFVPARLGPRLPQLPARAVIAVRHYAIRYTSYGPPRDRLSLVIYTADWIGTSAVTLRDAVPLQQVEAVSIVLPQLDHTRRIEDRRRLQVYTTPDGEAGSEQRNEEAGSEQRNEEAGSEQRNEEADAKAEEERQAQAAMAPTIKDSSQTQQPYTQMDFGTQLSPAQSRSRKDRPRPGGYRTPNTSRPAKARSEDTQPPVAVPDPALHHLLNLLGNPKKPEVGQPASPRPTTPVHSSLSSRPWTPSVRVPRPQGSPLKELAVHGEAPSSVIAGSRAVPIAPGKTHGPDGDNDSNMQSSWMTGFVFNSEAMVPDSMQRVVLSHDESWYKQQPGVLPFPDNNMPHRWFSKFCAIADEHAAAQGLTQSDSEDAVDPSPSSGPEQLEPGSSTALVIKVPHDEEPTTSQISWSASPTPEPPQRSAHTKRAFPPDSSASVGESTAMAGKITNLAPSQVRSARDGWEQSALPSSPPVIKVPADSDEEMEMEMETSVPQALGETITSVVHVGSSQNQVSASQSADNQPMVQVEETPRAKVAYDHIPPRIQGLENMDTIMSEANVTCDPIPESTKRKLEESPINKSPRRLVKRRELKVTNFAEYVPWADDPLEALRKERAESLKKFIEERKSGRSPEAQQVAEAMEVDIATTTANDTTSRAMSPGHQSLHDEPSPSKALSEAVHSPASPNLSPVASPQLSPIAPSLVSPAPSPQLLVAASPHVSPTVARHPSVSAGASPHLSARTAMPLPHAIKPQTVLETFQLAYPEYVGNARHFRGQCAQMYQLDQEDKMVPKWQWDDFIIRNTTDYRNYVLDCVENGEDPEPYFRFYKDTVRNSLYTKGIINSQRTLLRALAELDAEPLAPPQNNTLRSSPPSTTHQSEQSQGHNSNALQKQPHRSLPLRSPSDRKQRAPAPVSVTSAFRLPSLPASARINENCAGSKPRAPKDSHLSRPSLGPLPSVTDIAGSTGDPFRDFYFSVQRAKSLQGCNKRSTTESRSHSILQ